MLSGTKRDSLRETIAYFQVTVKEQILTGIKWAQDAKNYIKDTAKDASKWIVLQTAKSKQIIQQALQSSYHIVKESLQYAFRQTILILTHAPQFIVRTITRARQILSKAFRLGYKLTLNVLNTCWEIMKAVARGLKLIAQMIPEILRELPPLIKELALMGWDLIKSAMVNVTTELYNLMKTLLSHVGHFIKNMASFMRVLFEKAVSYVLKGIGLLIGIGAAIVELGTEAFKSLLGIKQVEPVSLEVTNSKRGDHFEISLASQPVLAPQFEQSKHREYTKSDETSLSNSAIPETNMRLYNRYS